jgi:heme-degrading monooxygenase HmoA
MILRVTRGHFDAAKYEQIERGLQEQWVPSVKQMPGFRSLQLGVDRDTGTFVAASAWDSPEQSEALRATRAPFEGLGMRYEGTDIYEVVAQA